MRQRTGGKREKWLYRWDTCREHKGSSAPGTAGDDELKERHHLQAWTVGGLVTLTTAGARLMCGQAAHGKEIKADLLESPSGE